MASQGLVASARPQKENVMKAVLLGWGIWMLTLSLMISRHDVQLGDMLVGGFVAGMGAVLITLWAL